VDVKRQIGVVPEGMALFGRLTGAEYLNFVGCMYGLDRETAGKRTAELLDFMQLADQPKTLVTDYSHGMQKKLAMAGAVIHGPRVLFLDEPFEGVDAIASGTLKAMLQRMIARGATIFLTSHVLEIVERLCSHLAIIHRGRLVAQGSLEELRAGVEAQAAAALAGTSPGESAVPAPGEKLTLEEIFLRIVGGTRGAEQELSWLG
jgi:ABC-2 type transport system ATP-binding protein